MKKILSALSFLVFASTASAVPNGGLIEKCVVDLKAVYQYTNDQAAQACAHLSNPANLSMLEECVGDLTNVYGFSTQQTVTACAGVTDLASLESCIGDLENTQGFNHDQAAKACSQR